MLSKLNCLIYEMVIVTYSLISKEFILNIEAYLLEFRNLCREEATISIVFYKRNLMIIICFQLCLDKQMACCKSVLLKQIQIFIVGIACFQILKQKI